MEKLQDGVQEIAWLGCELQREVEALADTPFPHIHTFLTVNLLHAIEKQVRGMRLVLIDEQEEKAS